MKSRPKRSATTRRELVVAEDPAFDQDQAGRTALFTAGVDGLLDRLTVRQAEVHDDLADHARGAAGVAGRVEALGELLGGRRDRVRRLVRGPGGGRSAVGVAVLAIPLHIGIGRWPS